MTAVWAKTKDFMGVIALVFVIFASASGGLFTLDARYVDIDTYHSFVAEVRAFNIRIERDFRKRWLESEIRSSQREKFALRSKELTGKLTAFEAERLVIVDADLRWLGEQLILAKAER